jgi:hypothetical protein
MFQQKRMESFHYTQDCRGKRPGKRDSADIQEKSPGEDSIPGSFPKLHFHVLKNIGVLTGRK